MRLRIALCALLTLSACAPAPQEPGRQPTPREYYEAKALFSVDGCKVWRFRDGGRSHYFADCRGTVSSAHTEYCGKNCYRRIVEETQTVGPQP